MTVVFPKQGGGGTGTVTSVSSSTAGITVATPTTTPALTLVSTLLPGHLWDSASAISPVSVTATTEGAANTCITGNSVTYDATEVRVEVFCPNAANPSGANLFILLFRDSTVVGRAIVAGTNAVNTGITVVAFDTPSAAAHTYSVKAIVSSGTGSFGAGAGGAGNYLPATLRITKT